MEKQVKIQSRSFYRSHLNQHLKKLELGLKLKLNPFYGDEIWPLNSMENLKISQYEMPKSSLVEQIFGAFRVPDNEANAGSRSRVKKVIERLV